VVAPQDIVVKRGEVTLETLFKSMGIPIENFTLDSLDTHSNHTTYGRFDKFNSKYNPFGTPPHPATFHTPRVHHTHMTRTRHTTHAPSSAHRHLVRAQTGSSDLRTIFLKKSNDIDGRYFGELLRKELDQLEMGRHEVRLILAARTHAT
jgi:hypothetical protein